MKTFILGFIAGSLLSGSIVWAALPNNRMDRERDKFVEDGSGNIAIRAVVVDM